MWISSWLESSCCDHAHSPPWRVIEPIQRRSVSPLSLCPSRRPSAQSSAKRPAVFQRLITCMRPSDNKPLEVNLKRNQVNTASLWDDSACFPDALTRAVFSNKGYLTFTALCFEEAAPLRDAWGPTGHEPTRTTHNRHKKKKKKPIWVGCQTLRAILVFFTAAALCLHPIWQVLMMFVEWKKKRRSCCDKRRS